jgi:hypothetical protein
MPKLVRRWCLYFALTQLAVPSVAAQDFASAVAQLVREISEPGPLASVSLIIKNFSSMNGSSVSAIRSSLIRDLQAHGWNVREHGEGDGELTVTVSENYLNYVLTAELLRSGGRQVAIVEVPRSSEKSSAERIILSRTLLISSDEKLLDATLVEGKIAEGAHLLGLTPSSIQLYQLQSGRWALQQTQPLGQQPPPARDLRGRIVPDKGNSFDAFLPGIRCTGVVTSTLSFTCRQSDDPWPLSDSRQVTAFYAPARNYFTGIISQTSRSGESLPPFYSAAITAAGIVVSGIDGHAHFTNGERHASLIPNHWGSALAALHTACLGDIVLASGAGDFTQSDSLTAATESDNEFSAASDPMIFAGPVLSLKTAADGQNAIAIVSSSGHYETYFLSAGCGG